MKNNKLLSSVLQMQCHLYPNSARKLKTVFPYKLTETQKNITKMDWKNGVSSDVLTTVSILLYCAAF